MADPIFVVAAPRSGGSLLADALGTSAGVTVAPGAVDAWIAAQCGDRERLTAADATPEVTAALRELMSKLAGELRLLDLSLRHATRVPFLHAVFPGATFIYVYRDPRLAAIDTEDDFTLEERAERWSSTTTILLDDLERLPPSSWMIIAFGGLVEQPQAVLARAAAFIGIPWSGTVPASLPPQAPLPEEVQAELERVDGITRAVAERARDLFGVRRPQPAPSPSANFRSVATQSFPQLLQALGVTLAVTTYQSGRLILFRAEDATTLNTHFRMFRSPMGLAIDAARLALGTATEVWDFRNVPAVAQQLAPPGKHDACFVPRKLHVTGDIRIHEIAYAAGELWIVNTRFSALCTLDADSTFVPRWKPPFISVLAAEDRCHLNGMAIVDDRVRYVTCLGTSDVAGGWRANKAAGGVLLDVPSGEIVLRGLSMPHSPRVYDGRFYVLESGKGTLATADLRTGKVETIVELPGFTRGLAFAGPFAFVGLSQVRESNVFGGIPLTQRVAQRECGIYAIDLRNGEVAAFLRFEGDVREIFDVQVLPARYPELVELDSPLVASTFTVPDHTLAMFGS